MSTLPMPRAQNAPCRPHPKRPLRLPRLVRALSRRFRGDAKGVTAVEFALLVAPFTAIMFAIIETSIFMFAQQALENAVSNQSRTILTGQAQRGGIDAATFKSRVCDDLVTFVDCPASLYIDVRTYTNFAGADPNAAMSGGNLDVSNIQFNPGGPTQIVVVRAMLEYPMLSSVLGFAGNQVNGKQTMLSTTTFRNEPYSSGP